MFVKVLMKGKWYLIISKDNCERKGKEGKWLVKIITIEKVKNESNRRKLKNLSNW